MVDIKFMHFLSLVLIMPAFFGCIKGLNITKLTVPRFVQNGTNDSVVLDCEFDYTEDEIRKLVIKWYHDDDTVCIYQWIPEYDSVTLSTKFENSINTDFEVTKDKYTKKRALNILRPTIEFSGVYTCHVQSLDASDMETEIMIVYAYPDNVHLNYSVSDGVVDIMCFVDNVFPVPQIELFHFGPGESDPSPVEDVYLHRVPQENHAYDAVLVTNITENELVTDTLHYFGCTVSIPGTDYEETKRIPYFPQAASSEEVVMGPNAAPKISLATTLCFLTLLPLLRLLC